MVKNLALILEKITTKNLVFCLKKLYPNDQKLIVNNFELC